MASRTPLTNEENVQGEPLTGSTADAVDTAMNGPGNSSNAFDLRSHHSCIV